MVWWLVAVGLLATPSAAATPDTVSLTLDGLGTMLGRVAPSAWTRRDIYHFQGIPYANSPSRQNRFKLPLVAGSWSGVLNATAFRNKCPQANNERELIELQLRIGRGEDVEDCLHLNVYTPQIPNSTCTSLLPVMFFIHGGSFRVGSARDLLPDYLLEEDIVLVVIQYRLGPLGFLTFDTDEVPGNMGLHDQLTALRWTSRHAASFCGDRHRLTLVGQSSGAAAVTLMMASPLVPPDLFQRVIVQSGSSLCDWAVDARPVAHSEAIARMSGCDLPSPTQMTACLRNQSAYQILMAHSDFLTEVLINEGRAVRGNNGGNHAVVERRRGAADRFLAEDPRTSFQEGRFKRVPMMVGVTKHEGSFFLGNIHDFILERNNATNNSDYLVNDFLKATLQFSGIDDTTGSITDLFQDKYFRVEEIGNFTAMVPGLVDICGVTLLKACTLQQARRNAAAQPTYLYSFSYHGKLTKFGYGDDAHHYPFPGGVAHSDDLLYLFPSSEGTLDENDKKMAQTVVKLWTSFASQGWPSATTIDFPWPPMNSTVGPYLRIDQPSTVENNFYVEYNIAATEGLQFYLHGVPNNAPFHTYWNVLFLILFIFTCRYRFT